MVDHALERCVANKIRRRRARVGQALEPDVVVGRSGARHGQDQGLVRADHLVGLAELGHRLSVDKPLVEIATLDDAEIIPSIERRHLRGLDAAERARCLSGDAVDVPESVGLEGEVDAAHDHSGPAPFCPKLKHLDAAADLDRTLGLGCQGRGGACLAARGRQAPVGHFPRARRGQPPLLGEQGWRAEIVGEDRRRGGPGAHRRTDAPNVTASRNSGILHQRFRGRGSNSLTRDR